MVETGPAPGPVATVRMVSSRNTEDMAHTRTAHLAGGAVPRETLLSQRDRAHQSAEYRSEPQGVRSTSLDGRNRGPPESGAAGDMQRLGVSRRRLCEVPAEGWGGKYN